MHGFFNVWQKWELYKLVCCNLIIENEFWCTLWFIWIQLSALQPTQRHDTKRAGSPYQCWNNVRQRGGDKCPHAAFWQLHGLRFSLYYLQLWMLHLPSVHVLLSYLHLPCSSSNTLMQVSILLCVSTCVRSFACRRFWGNDLSGTIPSELAALTRLTWMCVKTNRLTVEEAATSFVQSSITMNFTSFILNPPYTLVFEILVLYCKNLQSSYPPYGFGRGWSISDAVSGLSTDPTLVSLCLLSSNQSNREWLSHSRVTPICHAVWSDDVPRHRDIRVIPPYDTCVAQCIIEQIDTLKPKSFLMFEESSCKTSRCSLCSFNDILARIRWKFDYGTLDVFEHTTQIVVM